MSNLDELILQERKNHDVGYVTFSIEAEGIKKPIIAYLWLPSKVEAQSAKLHLVIVSHGAGGTALSPANLHLCQGVASHALLPSAASSPEQLAILGYNGNSNLKSRTKALQAVIQWASSCERVARITLAGRSMGCRASAIAYVETLATGTQHKLSDRLVLESYPLEGKGEDARKQILADLPEHVHVLFVIGTKDEMCSLERLKNAISADMQATSSLLVIKDADHGMNFTRPGRLPHTTKKEVTEHLGKRAGRETGEWLLQDLESSCRSGELSWPEEDSEDNPDCVWSGWTDDIGLQKDPEKTPAKRSREVSQEQQPEQNTGRPKRRKKV
jgi:predicted alpha/beta-hydrolase family hydrolase